MFWTATPPTDTEHRPFLKRRLTDFMPTLAGGAPRDQMVAGIGPTLGHLSDRINMWTDVRKRPNLPFIVAPMGASAVLLFAVPASPLAQPWSIIGGNTVSALVGISVGRLVHEPMAATGIAVGLAIVAMSMNSAPSPAGRSGCSHGNHRRPISYRGRVHVRTSPRLHQRHSPGFSGHSVS